MTYDDYIIGKQKTVRDAGFEPLPLIAPLTGIGSEGYGALTLGRRFVGSELKKSYAEHAVTNLRNIEAQPSLF